MTVSRQALRRFHPGGGLGRRMVPMPDLGCLYVKVPKAGCSTITLWLHRIHTGDHASRPARIHRDNALPAVEEVGWPRVLEMLDDDTFRFTFVRDPFTRTESAYWSKVAVPHSNHWPALSAALETARAQPDGVPTFEEYLDAIEATSPLALDPHFRPQHLVVMWGLVEYDVVGRLESFDADFARVRERLGSPATFPEVPNARPRTASVYDGRPDRRRRVAEIYAGDFEAFHYPVLPA